MNYKVQLHKHLIVTYRRLQCSQKQNSKYKYHKHSKLRNKKSNNGFDYYFGLKKKNEENY